MFPVSGSSLDLHRLLLNFQLLVSARDLQPLPVSCSDSGFMFPVSESGLVMLRSLLNFPVSVPGQALVRVRLQPGFQFLIYGFRFWFELAPLAFQSQASGFRLGSSAIA